MRIRKIEWLDKYPIAHRGYHNQEVPENTLEAFKLAVDNNYAIELDIQFTKDYQIVVFHDDDFIHLLDDDLAGDYFIDFDLNSVDMEFINFGFCGRLIK